MLLAGNSIFLAVASMLQVFQIEKAKGSDGRMITPEVDFNGFIRYVSSADLLPQLDLDVVHIM